MQILPTARIEKVINTLRPTRSASTASLTSSSTSAEKAFATTHTSEVHPIPRKARFNFRVFAMAFISLISLVALILASIALAIDTDTNADLVAKLKTANTALDRLALLPSDSDWLFDFTKSDKYTFAPGGVVNANAATFPATVGNGLTMAMLNLGPCAMLPPHYHPRASNYVVAVQGTTDTYMIAENGARTVKETLTPGKMTIFPQASVHTMMNTGCENAQLVSALAADDAGTHNIANALFSLPPEIVGTVLGAGVNVNATEGAIPAVGTGSNAGPEACLARCHAQGKMIKRSW